MPRVVGIDHLVLSVGGFARSRDASRKDVDALGVFLAANRMTVIDPPGEYNGDPNYYAVFFADPDGMKLEGMVYKPARKKRAGRKQKKK